MSYTELLKQETKRAEVLKYLNKFPSWFLCLLLSIMIAFLTFLFLYLSFVGEMAPQHSKDSFQTALARCRAQAAQGTALVAASKLVGDSSEMSSDSSPLIIKRGRRGPSLRWFNQRQLRLANMW